MKANAPATMRSERVRQRLSLDDVAGRSGLSPSTVSRIEMGENRQPRAVTVKALLDALAVIGELPDVYARPPAEPLTIRQALAIVAAAELDSSAA